MSRKEARRPGLVQLAVAGKITTAAGARALEMSLRQFRRLKARYRAEGVRGLVHRRRGQPSPRPWTSSSATAWPSWSRPRTGTSMTATPPRSSGARGPARQPQHRPPDSAGPGPAPQAPAPAAAAPRPPPPPPGHGRPRPRRRQPVRLARHGHAHVLLLGAIDDATSTVLALHFRPAEDLHGYLTLLGRLAARHGLPVTLYGDRLGVFVRNDAHWTLEEELQGAQHPTQFGQILRDLGIGYIAAHSPQAKGRIERLWATLQDRLVAELRLRGIHTVAAAEAFLPTYLADHNRRFAQPPAEPAAAVAPPAPRPRRSPQLPLHAPRRPRQHRPARPPVVQIPRGPHGRSYAGVPRRGPRMPRWPPARRLSGAPPRHRARPRGRFRAGPPPGATPPRLQERRPRRGAAISPFAKIGLLRRAPRSPPWPSTCAVPRARIPGGRPSRAANANAVARRPSPPDGRTFSLNS